MATQLDTAVAGVADAPASAEVSAAGTSAANDTQQTDDLAGLYPDEQNTGTEPEQGEDQSEPDQQQDEIEPEAAIDAPVSWNKEAKEKFAQLPPDMQTFLAQQDAQRNRQVQDVTTRAKEAQHQAAAEAAQQVANSQQLYAQQLEMVAASFLPPEPNPAQFQDMQSFAHAKFQYDQAHAQHQQLMQHAQQIRSQADQQTQQYAQEAILRDARNVALDLPEVRDATAYQQLVQDLTPIARELGYDDQRIAQAWPSDVLAMRRVAEYKADAQKWRQLQSRKMEGVRAAKNLPKVTQPGAGGAAQASDDPLALLYKNDLRR
jgi:hypothetical protein